MQNDNKLSDVLNVTVGGDTRAIKMTWGMLTLLSSYFTDMGQIENLNLDSGLQNTLINELVAERDEDGVRINSHKNYALDMTMEEGKRVSRWMMEHLSNFFISQLQEQIEATKKLQPVVEEIIKANQATETKSKRASTGSKA
jgi:hypothetical protein